MMTVDYSMLFVGVVRSFVWLIGACWAIHNRRVLQCAGFTMAVATSSVFAWSNAGGHVNEELFDMTALLATPTATLIVCGVILPPRNSIQLRVWRGWRL